MYCRMYFDTVAFRLIGDSFQSQTLPQELKDRILISPLTLHELWSQLTVGNGDVMLERVKSLCNWTNSRTGLLPWPDDAIYAIWHRKVAPDDGFTKKMETACNLCLAATSPAQLREAADGLKTAMDKFKLDMAVAFGQLVSAAKQQSLGSQDFSHRWFQGIAKRAKADVSSRSQNEIISTLNAYYTFEMEKLHVAIKSKDYNPEKHKNDVIDAEQLIYLSDPSLRFLTCDGGIQNLTKKSTQARQIVAVKKDSLSNAASVESVLRSIISSC